MFVKRVELKFSHSYYQSFTHFLLEFFNPLQQHPYANALTLFICVACTASKLSLGFFKEYFPPLQEHSVFF